MEEEKKKLTIVVFSGELDKALAAFMIAATAASMNIAVTMFFTFWGLNVIKKNNGKTQSKGLMRKMFNWLNKGGTKRLKLSKFNMMGMGTNHPLFFRYLNHPSPLPTRDALHIIASSWASPLLYVASDNSSIIETNRAASAGLRALSKHDLK